MRDEISAAVLFLTRLIEKGERFNREQLEHFKLHLSRLLVERCRDHWFPDKPDKGQGYRCIRVNGVFHDPIIRKAARASGMKYEDVQLPYELTVWVDPNEVCCRFGENKGSFCTLASFNSKLASQDSRTLVAECTILDKDSPIPSPPPRFPLHCGNAERKRDINGGEKSYHGYHQQRTGGWRHWSSPPRTYHSYNQHYHYNHWHHKSTLKV